MNVCVCNCVYWSFTDDKDDFRSWSGWIEHLVLLYELRRLRQVRIALDGKLADGRQAVIPSVGKIGTVGQHCHTHTRMRTETLDETLINCLPLIVFRYLCLTHTYTILNA